MAWDFSTEPEFEEKLEWIRWFRAERVDPLDLVYPDRAFHPLDEETGPVVRALKQQVRDQGLWAPHLGPELGGRGFGQLKLALINEILGESSWAPVIFGTAAPDTGNAEIIARYGTEEQKERYLKPLLEGECFSCFSMTEPQAGADPKMFTTRAVRDDGGTSRSSGAESGGDWVITGRKFFSSNARTSKFVIVMAVTDPDVSAYRGMSMFLVPSDTPGIRMERHLGLMSEAPDEGMHALIEYDGVRVPGDALLGGEGQAFAIAQTRLGGGRVHHAMRVVGQCQKALDMMAERALSRETQGSRLADKQLVQADLADSYAQLQQFRLFVLHTAWQIDRYQDYKRVRKDISAIKFLTPKVLHDIVYRSMHLHGALGVSNEMPFADMWTGAAVMAVVDGPSEIHKVTVAKDLLRGYEAASGPWPSQHLPARREWARKQLENM
jgi:acyl-CoA dehydrogenase